MAVAVVQVLWGKRTMTRDALERTRALLEEGEEISVLLGNGPRPSELKLGPNIQRALRSILLKAVVSELAAKGDGHE